MLTILPPCPSCNESDLYRVAGPAVRFKCSECGFDTGLLGMATVPDAGLALLERRLTALLGQAKAERGAT